MERLFKLQFRVLLLVLFLLPVSLVSQVYTGEVIGGSDMPETNKKERRQRNTSTSAGKQKYIKLTYFMPEMYPYAYYSEGPFIPGSGPVFGALFERGGFRFFSDNFMINGMANIGLYSGFGLGVEVHDFNLQDDFDGYKLPFFFVDYKIGPDFRFEISNNLKFDLYGSIGALASYGGLIYGSYSGGPEFTYQQRVPVLTLQTGVGFNVVLMNWLILGTHFTFADGTYKYTIDNEFGSTEENYDVSLNSFRVSIGFFP